jgi:hypothetical protein
MIMIGPLERPAASAAACKLQTQRSNLASTLARESIDIDYDYDCILIVNVLQFVKSVRDSGLVWNG